MPHLRTSTPSQVTLRFGVNMLYGTNNQVVELNASITVYGINLKTTAKTPQLHSPKPSATRSHTNTATYSLTKRRTYSLTKHRNLFTLKTPYLKYRGQSITMVLFVGSLPLFM